jgi:protein-S-isoprenylcysteine O-methyltransferase Ste14
MVKRTFMDLYLSSGNATKKILDWGEWILLVAVGVIFKEPRLGDSIIYFVSGAILIILGVYMHSLSHKIHFQAHYRKEDITKLATTGIYSKIRHPGYLGYIMGYFGVFLMIGAYSMLAVIFLYLVSFSLSIRSEEKYLRSKFGKEYDDYARRVQWRLIPYII